MEELQELESYLDLQNWLAATRVQDLSEANDVVVFSLIRVGVSDMASLQPSTHTLYHAQAAELSSSLSGTEIEALSEEALGGLLA